MVTLFLWWLRILVLMMALKRELTSRIGVAVTTGMAIVVKKVVGIDKRTEN
jgi:hypothetical protein